MHCILAFSALEKTAHMRCVLAGFGAAFLIALVLSAPASSQQYAAPRYGEPYKAPPPAFVGKRRALDGTPRRNQPAPAPYYPPVRPRIWEGLYLGGHGGYSFGAATPSNGSDSVDMSGGALGAHLGYNFQNGDWVFGLEADGSWNNASGSGAFAGPTFVDAHTDWTSSLRGRLGYSFGAVLLYATGGVAVGGFDLGVDTGIISSRVNETVFGYVAGGGIEAKLHDNWSGRIEALHYGFGEKHFGFASGNIPVDLGVTTVRAGLTYHFR